MKKIVIVGASSGIGLGVAEALASRGVRVGLAARKTRVLHELKEKYPDKVEYQQIDVTTSTAPKHLGELIEKLGGMDIYVHIAGIGHDNPEMKPDLEADVVNTNCTGFARMIAAAYDYFAGRTAGGSIVALTSVAGVRGMADLAAYSASKRFDYAYLEALDQRITRMNQKITLTDIRPGWIRTPLLSSEKKYPMEISLEEAVPQIIRAIVRRPRYAYVGPLWGIVAALARTIPPCIWRRMGAMTGRL